MTRAFRRLVGRALIGLMLFAQLAIAAHACPALSAPARDAGMASCEDMSPMTTGPADEGLPDCDRSPGFLDPASPNLCAEHCSQGQQSDQTSTPTLSAAVLESFYTVPAVPEAPPRGRPWAAPDSARAAAAPSLAILHCRFRN